MNYYKQGDAAKADKIKAAFESKGIYSDCNFENENYLYYSCDGKVAFCFIGGGLAEIIKTHPDYKELELPVEPKFKFKVGDWIVQNDNGTVSQITKTINGKDEYGEYRAYEHTNGYFAACFENEYHLWKIADAKDGDVLVNQNGEMPFVFKSCKSNHIYCHCAYTNHKDIFFEKFLDYGRELHWINLLHEQVQPATKEQRDLLFAKMKEAGYQWDADKKELHKIQPHYDIANFHAGMPVLVRDYNNSQWSYVQFSHLIAERNVGEGGFKFNACGIPYIQCIPFEGNEHLLGTADMCDERFLNW